MGKQKTPAEVETKIIAAIQAGLTISDIAKRFNVNDRTVYRIKNHAIATSDDIPMTIKRVKSVVGCDKPARKAQAQKDGKALQDEIAAVGFAKALELFNSIDPSKMPESSKAMSGAVLLDKARLITGQASSLTEHRDIQVVALKLLDTRKKASKVIDIRPDAPQNHIASPTYNADVIDVEPNKA